MLIRVGRPRFSGAEEVRGWCGEVSDRLDRLKGGDVEGIFVDNLAVFGSSAQVA